MKDTQECVFLFFHHPKHGNPLQEGQQSKLPCTREEQPG